MSQRSGFFVLDKPPEISSARAIAQLQKKLKIEKVGHAGTLDPFATGILVVLVNRATKLASVAAGGEKRYRAIFRFGIATDSDDKTGKVIQVSERIPTRDDIDRIVNSFTGTILQRPPRISAVKINGKRAYKRARADEDFEIKERTISISQIEVHRFEGGDLELSVSCGSGTYIRSIARDFGLALDSCATVISLRREVSEPFSLGHAVRAESAEWESLLPWDHVFTGLSRVSVSAAQAQGLAGGDVRICAELAKTVLPADAKAGERMIFQLAGNNASLGLLEFNGQEWKLWSYLGE